MQHRRIRSLMVLMALVVLIGSMRPEASRATEPIIDPACNLYGTELPGPGFWTAVWNFNGPEYCLITTSLPEQPNQQPVTTYQVVACTVQGNIGWAGSFAILHGEDYLACPFTAPASGSVIDYEHFWMYAQTSVYASGGANPIFYHPDLRLSQPAAGANTTTLNWEFRRSDNLLAAGATRRFLTSSDDRLRAETCLTNSPDCIAGPQGIYAQFASVNSKQLPASAVSGAVRLHTAPTTIYIGYNPETGTTFQGLLGMLVIDPPYGKDPEPDFLPSPQ